MRSVTPASAEISVIGSKLAMYCAERDSASILASRTQTIVGEEDHVELAALGGLRDLDVMLEVHAGIGLRAPDAATMRHDGRSG